ncbi:MAG: hypothetical protein MJ240_09695 [Kiritimatiellae bacterium]|nr:hypothetical protein [Kiritimatiellia bacterium]
MRYALPLLAVFVLSASAAEVTRIFRPERHTRGDTNTRRVQAIDEAAWIGLQEVYPAPRTGYSAQEGVADECRFYRFRRTFESAGGKLTFDVSADERFWLILDGEVIARGPHRGMVTRWYYQSYEVALTPGAHTLEAVVTALGTHAPRAQLSFRGGSFILKAEGAYDALLTTGRAKWTCARIIGTKMDGLGTSGTFGAGDQCASVGTGFLDELPEEGAYQQTVVVRSPVRDGVFGPHAGGWELYPSERPEQMHEEKRPGRIVNGDWPTSIPANTTRELLWDLEDYYCAWPELVVSGGKGATIQWGWTESLRAPGKGTGRAGGPKGNRDLWEGKVFSQAFTDTFSCDGRNRAAFTAPWWRCGRWCKLTFTTADEPLAIQKLVIAETRYPMPVEGSFACSDASLSDIARICVRGLQTCMHEMYFDCPYYEQQMYPGDTRLEMLFANMLSADDRLTRFGMMIFDWDRRSNGMAPMNFPTWGTQESSTYTMCWLLMFRDYVMWHRNTAWLKARLPGVRHALSGLELHENADGLLENLPGWSFMDWVKGWDIGNAPNGKPGQGVSALNNLLYVLALQSAAVLEDELGHPDMAAVWRGKAARLGQRVRTLFWCAEKGCMADTVKKDCFSEHAQCLSLLAGILPPAEASRAFAFLEKGEGLSPCSTYFANYLFDAYAAAGRTDLFLKKLDMWRTFLAHGAKTPFETQRVESRSDCHAWCSAPLYQFHVALAGVSPAASGFRKVRVAPQPASLTWLTAKTPHPDGFVVTDLRFGEGKVRGTVTLPAKVSGEFVWRGTTRALVPGLNEIDE